MTPELEAEIKDHYNDVTLLGDLVGKLRAALSDTEAQLAASRSIPGTPEGWRLIRLEAQYFMDGREEQQRLVPILEPFTSPPAETLIMRLLVPNIESASPADKEICICAAIRAVTEQGFITSRNRFVGREEAMRLHRAAGLKSAAYGELRGDILFSEDLYMQEIASTQSAIEPLCPDSPDGNHHAGEIGSDEDINPAHYSPTAPCWYCGEKPARLSDELPTNSYNGERCSVCGKFKRSAYILLVDPCNCADKSSPIHRGK